MKKIYLVLLIVLSFFGFSERVDAAKELACYYEGDNGSDPTLIVQKSNGDILGFYNVGFRVGMTGENWIFYQDGSDMLWEDGSSVAKTGLSECPKSVGQSNFDKVHQVWPYVLYNYESKDAFSKLIEESNNFNFSNGITYSSRDLIRRGREDFAATSCGSISNFWVTPYVEGGDYKLSCVYASDKVASSTCHVIQVNVTDDEQLHIEQIYPTTRMVEDDGLKFYNKGLTINIIKDSYSGNCPSILKVKTSSEHWGESSWTTNIFSESGGTDYPLVKFDGYNLVTGEKASEKIPIRFEKITKFINCDQLIDDVELKNMLRTIVNLFKILVPIILVIFGSLDFAKAIFSGSQDDMKKNTIKFIKRVIIAVVIFLVPTLLKFMLAIANTVWGNISTDLCGII